KVGKEILNSCLEKKVRLIPLSKNTARINLSTLCAAERISDGQVRSALSLVRYPTNVAKAIEFVCSDTLICNSPEIAKRVTFADA
ncbi:hypothetical protein B0H11DRAFT_2011364, partial [Mycena galericulata]